MCIETRDLDLDLVARAGWRGTFNVERSTLNDRLATPCGITP